MLGNKEINPQLLETAVMPSTAKVNINNKIKNMKLETLEEASKRYSYGGREGGHRTPFLEGVKWQEQRSYSEENMRKAFCAGFASNITSSINDAFEKWFEQFKNKYVESES